MLDDSMAMPPRLRLWRFAQAVVGTRTSRSGNATSLPSELTDQGGAVAPGASNVRVLIDQMQP